MLSRVPRPALWRAALGIQPPSSPSTPRRAPASAGPLVAFVCLVVNSDMSRARGCVFEDSTTKSTKSTNGGGQAKPRHRMLSLRRRVTFVLFVFFVVQIFLGLSCRHRSEEHTSELQSL